MYVARSLFLVVSTIFFPVDYSAAQGGRELSAPYVPNPYYQNMPVEPGLQDDPLGNGIMGKAPYAVIEGAGAGIARGVGSGIFSGTTGEIYKYRDEATTKIQELPTFNNFTPPPANQRRREERRSQQRWIPNPDYFKEKSPNSYGGHGGSGSGVR